MSGPPSTGKRLADLFTSDEFLEAFAPAIGGVPIYGEKTWVVERLFVKMAYCSPWNGFIKDPSVDDLISAAEKHGCWAMTFTSAGLVEDPRLDELSPVPTPIVSGKYSPSKKVRWSVKRAQSYGFEVGNISVDAAYPVFSRLWDRLRRGLPASFYRRMESIGAGQTIAALKSGQPVSCLFCLTDEDGVRYMYSLATLPEFKETHVTTLLVHTFLERVLGSGTPYVDLCGCTERAIYRFKSQFTDQIMFRPRYLHVIKKPIWKLVSWKSTTIYSDLVPPFIDGSNWKSRIVGSPNS